jgi:hypothetical protein
MAGAELLALKLSPSWRCTSKSVNDLLAMRQTTLAAGLFVVA